MKFINKTVNTEMHHLGWSSNCKKRENKIHGAIYECCSTNNEYFV